MGRQEILETADMLEVLEPEQSRMGDWEQKFMTSIMKWFYEDGRELTKRQFDTLQQIHERYV